MIDELLDRSRSVLVIIDIQEKLYPHVHDHESMLIRIDLLMSAARLMAIPVIVTEQYPKGLGPTIPDLRQLMPETPPLAKMDFSCVPVPGFMEQLESFKRNQVILAGIEAHVCVAQTALDLAHRGEKVIVVADGVSSRRALDVEIALRRLEHSGITLVTAESIVFEWLRRAGTEEFKVLQPKLKRL